MNQYKNMQNSPLILNILLQQRPELQSVLAIQQKGASWQQIAEVMAQQKGIDLNNLIQQLQS